MTSRDSTTSSSTTVRICLNAVFGSFSILIFFMYTEGTTEYTDCNGLLTASSATFPNSALFQIIAAGIDQSKLVIGKPGSTADATNGFMDPDTLATCVSQASAQGWSESFFLSFLPPSPPPTNV